MPKITYIDQPSYLPDWARKRLSEFATLEVFNDRPTAEVAAARLRDTDLAIVEWTTIGRDILREPGKLKYLVLVTTGYASVDVVAAREHGVIVCNTPQYSRQSVAEHTFAMFLSLAKRLIPADKLVRSGSSDYTRHAIGVELCGKTLGIVGMGSIGSWVAKIGAGFGMNVLGFSRSTFDVNGVPQKRNLVEMLSSCDFVASCVSVNPTSRGLFSSEVLKAIKPGAIFVNIAGNAVLDEPALRKLLEDGTLYGAGFDDLDGSDLLSTPNTLLTPGTAWYTQASLDRNVDMFVETARACLAGAPRHIVS